jgi:putative aminopeptidase FrvX
MTFYFTGTHTSLLTSAYLSPSTVSWFGWAVIGTLLLGVAPVSRARAQESSVSTIAVRLTSMTAVTGYEQAMVDTLLGLLPGSSRDRAGNARLTVGDGTPQRLVVCPMDEPGYVVGSIRDDGYLTLRRVPGRVSALFDQQIEGHRVTIHGAHRAVPGVVAVRSIHLTRGRKLADEPFTVDDAYVDVGAASREEAAALGIAVLTPVTLTKRPHSYGRALLAAPVAGRRAACAALLVAVRQFAGRENRVGTVVAAFAVEQELTQRGLATLANASGPFDETLIVDGNPGPRGAPQQSLDPGTSARWPALGKVSRLSLPASYTGTVVETVSLADADSLHRAIVSWMRKSP